MRTRRAKVVAASLLPATTGALLAFAGAAWAATGGSPYDDPTASGSVGFCDRTGHQVTSGRTDTKPFVWRAVGTAPAPVPFRGPVQQATLFAFQPRQGVAPGDWSGDSLTAASVYTNAEHPMAQATGVDLSLAQFLSEYPVLWDHIVQLRLSYSAPNLPTDPTSYAAVDVRVEGNRWTVVNPGRVDCRAGSAQSTEGLVPASMQPGSSADHSGPATGVPAGSPSGASAAEVTAHRDDAATTGAVVSLRAQRRSDAGWLWAAAAVAVSGSATAAWWTRRRRRTSQTTATTQQTRPAEHLPV